MAATANIIRTYEEGVRNEFGVKASTHIFQGVAVGIEVATGYARGLVAGDLFAGFAEAEADNSATATNGYINVRVLDSGKVELAISSLAITDIGKPVYASADNTFTLTASNNTYIGKIIRWVSTGYGIVEFEAGDKGGIITALTDNTGGTANSTLAALGAIVTLTDNTGYSGTHDDTLAATTVPANITGTLTGTVDGAMVDIAATAGGCEGGATPTAGQVDAAIATAVGTIVSGTNEQMKELLTQVNAIGTLLAVMCQNQSDTSQRSSSAWLTSRPQRTTSRTWPPR